MVRDVTFDDTFRTSYSYVPRAVCVSGPAPLQISSGGSHAPAALATSPAAPRLLKIPMMPNPA